MLLLFLYSTNNYLSDNGPSHSFLKKYRTITVEYIRNFDLCLHNDRVVAKVMSLSKHHLFHNIY